MKNLALFLLLGGFLFSISCKENDSKSENFKLLTGPVWSSDSLLVNGFDAGGPAGILHGFKGNAKFNEDGTGYFGAYTGTWRFALNESEIIITADSLAIPLTTKIALLTSTSLKITTSFPNAVNPATPLLIRMTFKGQ